MKFSIHPHPPFLGLALLANYNGAKVFVCMCVCMSTNLPQSSQRCIAN